MVRAQARAADGLQQPQHVARRLRHGVRAEVLDEPHQVIELLAAAHIVFVMLKTKKGLFMRILMIDFSKLIIYHLSKLSQIEVLIVYYHSFSLSGLTFEIYERIFKVVFTIDALVGYPS